MFNLLISEHLVLAAVGEWAASRRFLGRFLKIFVGLLNQHESLSCLPRKHESQIIKTQGKHVTQKFLQDLKGLKSWGESAANPRSSHGQGLRAATGQREPPGGAPETPAPELLRPGPRACSWAHTRSPAGCQAPGCTLGRPQGAGLARALPSQNSRSSASF